jgi:hypothetical protein
MAQRIRGKEVTLEVVVGGVKKTGSFVTVMNYSLTPDDEVVKTQFAGQQVSELDYNHKGYDFKFEIQKQDGKALDVLRDFVAKQAANQPHPDTQIIVTEKYRTTSGTTSNTYVLRGIAMKMDEDGFGSGDEYVSSKFSGSAKYMLVQ